MGIQFQCDNRLFTAALARVKVILEKQQKKLCGYEQDTGNSVYEQMEAIYQALSERNPVSGADCGNQKEIRMSIPISEREAIFDGKQKIVLAASSALDRTASVLDQAVYYCALLLKAGLHPVLIFSENQVAVGTWIYEDYNMGEARISTPDFAEEAYDAGGMMLAADCGCLMESAAFSEAVEAGCRVVADFVFAEDVTLENESENEQAEEPVILLTDSEGNQEQPVNLSEENCPYFKELLLLYDQIVDQEPMADCILSDAVRNQQWAAAFFEKWAADSLVQGEDLLNPLLLVETGEKPQELISADVIRQEVSRKNRVLVLASEERLKKVTDQFAGRKLADSILTVRQKDVTEDKAAFFARIYGFLVNRCQEKETPDDKRIHVKKRRYGEIVEKLENYNKILDKPTGCGRTLGELLEGWELVKDCPVELVISPDKDWNAEILDLVRQYANAWEKCRLRDQSGEVYLDFTKLTLAQKQDLTELLHACENPAGVLYTAVEAFGRKIGRDREEDETARSYLQAITGCAEILDACLTLTKLQKMPEYIPEVQEKDQEEKEAYEAFLVRQKHRKVLERFVDVSRLSLLEEEAVAALLHACTEVQNERSNHSLIRSRAYKVALKEMQELLESVARPEITLKHLNGEIWNGICLGLLEYSEPSDEEQKSNELIFREMSELLGEDVLSDSYLFIHQKMMVQNFLELKKSRAISDWLASQMTECIVAASRGMELEPKQKKLYEDAGKIVSVSDQYSEAIKKVFRFLQIDYHTFLKYYENESMMNFVVTWEQLLEEEQVFDEFQKIRVVLLRKQLGGVLEQLEEKHLTPEMLYQGFEKAWYYCNRNRYMEESGFDLQDYTMNLASMDKIEEQIDRNEEIQLENCLLRDVKLACQEFSEALEAFGQESGGVLPMNLVQQVFPAMLMTPETALMLLEASEMFFDRILICGAEEIPFYKVLYPVTRGQRLSLITDQIYGEKNSGIDSVAERARKMGFPVIRAV